MSGVGSNEGNRSSRTKQTSGKGGKEGDFHDETYDCLTGGNDDELVVKESVSPDKSEFACRPESNQMIRGALRDGALHSKG